MSAFSLKSIWILCLAGTLVACGGGGAGSSPSTDNPVITPAPDTGTDAGSNTGDNGADAGQGGATAQPRWTASSPDSAIHFVMTKKIHVAEVGQFSGIDGSVNDDGAATLRIDLSSVNTANGTRDQRLRDLLFEVAQFPAADVEAQLNLAAIEAIAIGSEQTLSVTATLSLHGHSQPLTAQVQVARLAANRLLVRTQAPILLDASAFGLQPGVDQLKALAGLTSIGITVPVDLHLVFVRAEVQP